MSQITDKTVLLFYKDYEPDRLVKYDHYLKRLVRPLYNRVRRSQSLSGFYVAYMSLIRALRGAGYVVEQNNYRLARQYPTHPVGIVGYPHILNNWQLPNPAILGPGLYDHPKIRPALMQDDRFHFYIVHSDWVEDMFRPAYGDACVQWYAGIDTDLWRDMRNHPKDIDVLVYDKVHWNRDQYEQSLLAPATSTIAARGLSYHILRYGKYNHAIYQDLLSRSRAMLFLGEHETQGQAYQEAMASNVPILAWDQGWWLDPIRSLYSSTPVRACSVPYFSPTCGERFRDIAEFEQTLNTFWSRLPTYEPRRYVQEHLSLDGSARVYMKYYSSLM